MTRSLPAGLLLGLAGLLGLLLVLALQALVGPLGVALQEAARVGGEDLDRKSVV